MAREKCQPDSDEWMNENKNPTIADCLVELRAKGVERIYVSNFGVIPENTDRADLLKALNSDAGDWSFFMEDTDVVAQVKPKR